MKAVELGAELQASREEARAAAAEHAQALHALQAQLAAAKQVRGAAWTWAGCGVLGFVRVC